jgi:transcriptional regulator with AAA-type ATPase domain
VKTHPDQKDLLNRGGRPTLGDLLDKMEFRPADGSILLNGARMVLQRATVGADIQDQLVKQLGSHTAMVFLLRMGYRAGREDADFIKQNWPNLEIGDAFTAGTRLHMLTGTVRVETLFNDFNFRTDRYASEFLWHDSVEASEYQRRHGRALTPVCWAQTGYATGYASQFFRKLVLFKEIQCASMGHKSCRVVGKTVDGWGKDDPYVQIFMNEVLPNRAGPATPHPKNSDHSLSPNTSQTFEDRVLAPVHARLKLIAQERLHALITGPDGSGRAIAAEWLHKRVFSDLGTLMRRTATSPDLAETIEKLEASAERRRGQGQTLIIDRIEQVPDHLQVELVRLLRTDTVDAPVLIIGLSTLSPSQLASDARLRSALFHGISVVPIEMPALSERTSDIPDLALALLDKLQQDATKHTEFSADALEAMCKTLWPGNLPELRSAIQRAVLFAPDSLLISTNEILPENRRTESNTTRDTQFDNIWALLEDAFAESAMTLDDLNSLIYRRVMERSGGNLSAAARSVGLSRAKLAYRLRTELDV